MTTNYVFKDNEVIHFILVMLLINRSIDIDCSVRMSNFLINIFKVPTKSLFLKNNFATFLPTWYDKDFTALSLFSYFPKQPGPGDVICNTKKGVHYFLLLPV